MLHKTYRKYGTFTVLILGLVIAGHSQQMGLIDHLGKATSAQLLPLRSFQLEPVFQLNYTELIVGNRRDEFLPNFLLRYAFDQKVELRVSNAFQRSTTTFQSGTSETDGITDLVLGLKFKLYHCPKRKAFAAVILDGVFPTGSRGFSNERIGFMGKLLLSRNIEDRWWVNVNGVYTYYDPKLVEYGGRVQVIYRFLEKLSLYVEISNNIQNRSSVLSASAGGGLIFRIHDALHVHGGLGLGLNNDQQLHRLGLSWRWAPPSKEIP